MTEPVQDRRPLKERDPEAYAAATAAWEKKEAERIAASKARGRFIVWALVALAAVGVAAFLGFEIVSGISSAGLFMIYVAWRLDQIAANTAGTLRELQKLNEARQ